MEYPIDPLPQSSITQMMTGLFGNTTDNRRCQIPARRLGWPQVCIKGHVILFRVELRHQGQQAAGLAGLERGVEDEITFLPDQTPDLFISQQDNAGTV